MAKKTVTQAYAATLIVGGKEIAPGTPVPLPEDEAKRIGDVFGVIPAIHEPVKAQRAQTTGSPKTPDLDGLAAALGKAQEDFDTAKAALEGENAGDDELKAFEAAEKALNAAEQALQDAQA